MFVCKETRSAGRGDANSFVIRQTDNTASEWQAPEIQRIREVQVMEIKYSNSELKSYLEEFRAQWEGRLGETGQALSSDLHKLVDLILTEQDLQIKEQEERIKALLDEVIEARVASWALQGSDEKIPMSKLDREGIMLAVCAPGFMTDGEQMELARGLFADLINRGVIVIGDR